MFYDFFVKILILYIILFLIKIKNINYQINMVWYRRTILSKFLFFKSKNLHFIVFNKHRHITQSHGKRVRIRVTTSSLTRGKVLLGGFNLEVI